RGGASMENLAHSASLAAWWPTVPPHRGIKHLGDSGEEVHIVVDGQQRIRAVLDYLHGEFSLDGDDVGKQWRGRKFEELTSEENKSIYNYKFVVRILPQL
ncbi:hypothetical protein, partial [Methylorubrum aminovorans]|uniref:hypothetical protein n=1 Tax=Methylorubrum aminovorans TaxID=269069 RepID=UPI003C2C0D79